MLIALAEKEAELERLHMENARLRQSVVGATEVIEQLEEPPMPPLVENNIVIPAHVVSDFVRMGRQLDREHLIRATMGSLAMISPDQPNIMVSSRHMAMLPRMNERSLCAGQLGGTSPRGSPTDWHVMEVILASVSVVTGGPAAVIHMHAPHTTTASCEKDLVLLNPIDEVGKHHIGKIIIVDPDDEQPDDYLRQVREALTQGNMRCVVVRGNGAYAVGADFDQAWANAAILEHSMQIHLLSRQANLKL
jgi:ribulose-5-phosphate 4-epimerase/fuculose-1-phosphate aldolase